MGARVMIVTVHIGGGATRGSRARRDLADVGWLRACDIGVDTTLRVWRADRDTA